MHRVLAIYLMAPLALLSAFTPSATAGDTNPAMSAPDRFAWETLVRISQPANNGSNDTIWETWASDEETFPNLPVAGQAPRWPGNTHRPLALTESRQLRLAREQMGRDGSKFSPRIVDGGNMEVRRNKPAFDFIVSQNLWHRDGLISAFGTQRPINFPVESIEIKAVWKSIQPADKPRYHWNVDSRGELFGLTGLHISTKDIPNWHWSTFEHVDNRMRGVELGCRDSFGTTPANSCAGALSPGLSALLSTGGLGPEWTNYRLAGSQVDFVDSTGRPLVLGNSVIESPFMKTSSCMTCHARAAMDVDANFLDIFRPERPPLQSYVGTPDPRWFYHQDGTRKLMQTDFVWAFEGAQPLAQDVGAGRSLPQQPVLAVAQNEQIRALSSSDDRETENDQVFAVIAANEAEELGGNDDAKVVKAFEALTATKELGRSLERPSQSAWQGINNLAEHEPRLRLVEELEPAYLQGFRQFIDQLSQNKRIIGGTIVDGVEELQFRDCVAVGSADKWCCSGTLIAPNVVLTAGHCNASCAKRVFVGLDVDRHTQGTIYRVAQAVVHKSFREPLLNDDLTVLILERDVENVAPRAIATAALIESAQFVRAVGFGRIDTEGSFGYGKKRRGDLEVISAGCAGRNDPAVFGCFNACELVAGRPGVDTCKGDSGGPVYILESTGDWYLAGATSRRTRMQALNPQLRSLRPCGDGGIYVRVDKYLDWIKSVPGGHWSTGNQR